MIVTIPAWLLWCSVLVIVSAMASLTAIGIYCLYLGRKGFKL